MLTILDRNLKQYNTEYENALVAFKENLLLDLASTMKVIKESEPECLSKLRINISFPDNHAKDYQNVIDMLARSVDATVNLTPMHFKHIIKITGHGHKTSRI